MHPAPRNEAHDRIDGTRVHILGSTDLAVRGEAAPLLDIVGDARVVAVGEGAHFVTQYWTLRRHLIRFLCEHADFKVVAMEFGIAEATDLTSWLNGEGVTEDLASLSPTATQWGAADMMYSLRAYNASTSAGGGQPLKLVGIDLPSAGGSFRPALEPLAQYIAVVDPGLTSALDGIQSITELVAAGSGVSSGTAWSELAATERDAVLAGLTKITLRMDALQPHYRTKSAPLAHHTALRLAQSALATAYTLQATHESASAHLVLDTSVREKFLADSVLALLEQPDEKIIVVAHNNHVQKTPVTFGDQPHTIPMGMYLSQRLGDDYRVIAQTTTDDHTPEMMLDTDSHVGFRVIDQRLAEPPDGSLERALLSIQSDAHPALVDVRAGDGMPALDRIRSQSGYVTTQLSAAFDAVIAHPVIAQQAGLGF